MIRATSAAVALAVLLACVPLAGAQKTVKVAKVAVPAVVAVLNDEGKVNGSGYLAAADGTIVTCKHCIPDGAESVRVRLHDGTEHDAKVMHTDAAEVAVLKINVGKPVPSLNLADKVPAVGSRVVVVGHPARLVWSVTAGIVSATGREMVFPTGKLSGLIQTDAAANPGSSGGPVLNLKGEVVGIIVGGNPRYQGVGYAVSAATIRRVMSEANHRGE